MILMKLFSSFFLALDVDLKHSDFKILDEIYFIMRICSPNLGNFAMWTDHINKLRKYFYYRYLSLEGASEKILK